MFLLFRFLYVRNNHDDGHVHGKLHGDVHRDVLCDWMKTHVHMPGCAQTSPMRGLKPSVNKNLNIFKLNTFLLRKLSLRSLIKF